MYWLDYSAAKLAGHTIAAAGYGGVVRYIDAPDRLRTKHTTKAEFDDHRNAGLRVWLVMQNLTTDADGGFNGGVGNANRALAGANHLGYDGPIFFCNDRTTVPNPGVWQSYLDGAAAVLGIGRVGAYGFGNAMDIAQGHATYFWQAGRRSEVRSHAHLWQDNNTQVTVGGVLCDRNLLLPPMEDDMPLSYQDIENIWAYVIKWAHLPDNPGGPAWMHIANANLSAQQANAKLDKLTDATAESLRQGIRDDVLAVLGADNTKAADEIVERLAKRMQI